MATTMLVELTVYDPTVSAEKVIRVATGAYDHPSAPDFYFDAILERSRLKREIFTEGSPFGSASTDYGRLLLNNKNGWLDWLVVNDCAADGRPMSIKIGEEGAAYGTFVPVFTGKIGQMLVGTDNVEVRIFDDFAATLDKAIQLDKFLGTNSGGVGVEGADDIKDQWAPVGYGPAINIAPVCVSTQNLIYCPVDRAVEALTISSVRDRGATLTKGVQRASLAALTSNTPATSSWDYFLGSATERAYIRLGSIPAGQITCDITTGAAAANRTAAQLYKRVLVERCGVAAGAILASDLTTLDAANAAEVGVWVDSAETTRREVLNRIAGTVGAGYWQDSAGSWRIKRTEAPTGTPVATFARLSLERPGALNDADIISITPLFTSRDDGGVPPWRILLNYARNYAVQSKDSLAGVALVNTQRYSQQWYQRVAENAATKTRHPMAGELEYDGYFALEAAAASEASRRLSLLGVTRRRYAVKVRLTPSIASAVDLGKVVKVEYDRFGLNAGKLFLVTAAEIDLLTMTAEYTVWG